MRDVPAEIEDADGVAALLGKVHTRDITRFEVEGLSVFFEFEVEVWSDEDQVHRPYHGRFEVNVHGGNIWYHERVDGEWVERFSNKRRY